MQTDQQLLDEFQSTGDRMAFARLCGRHQGIVAEWLEKTGMGRQEADAKACVALASVADKLGGYDRTKPLGPFLFTMAVNAALPAPPKPPADPKYLATVEALKACHPIAAAALNLPLGTFKARLKRAQHLGVV